MTADAAKRGLMERLADGPVLGDGGYLLELERRGYVQAGPYTPEVALRHPEALAGLHREFMFAGADVLEALTFYATDAKLASVGFPGTADEVNRAAVEIARAVADEGGALAAGVLTGTWEYVVDDKASAAHVREIFERQVELQQAAGVELFVCETFGFLGEALLAVAAATATGLPVVATMCYGREPISEEGVANADCARRLVDAGADVVGLNCVRGPHHMLPLAREMAEATGVPVAAQPVAYRLPEDQPEFGSLKEFPFELEHVQLTRAEMAQFAVDARDAGISLIGSCCGSAPYHVREMARSLGRDPDGERTWKPDYENPMSGFEYYGAGRKS
jgi:methionine synthase I (cobalamin-dependent)